MPSESPLSPSALAQVPEVRDKFSALRRVINERRDGDYHGPDPRVGHDIAADQAYRARRTEAEQGVVDAVLSAERQRLLGMTPEAVVEAAAKAIAWEHHNRDGYASPEQLWLALFPGVQNHWRKCVRAAVPILLAPEVAKREAVEAELFAETQGRELLVAAEAERDRLKAALERIDALARPQQEIDMRKVVGDTSAAAWNYQHIARAALSGRDTV